jgi:putative ABC transport system permease protein
LITLALLRFLRNTPWSTVMALAGVALGVTSIVSVHLISASVSQQLDELVPSSLARYSHFLHQDELHADDFFELRHRWRAGDEPGIYALSPIVDETIWIRGHAVRVLGVDLFSAGADLRREQSVSNPGADAAEFSWQGVWVDASLADVVAQTVNGVIQAPAGTLIADIGVAQDILGWPPTRLSYVGVSAWDTWSGLKEIGESLLPGFSAGLPRITAKLVHQPGWRVLELAQQHAASQFGKSVLFNISALGLLAMLVSWFLIYQVAVSWLRRLWTVFERLHVLGVDWSTLQVYFLSMMGLLGVSAGVVGLYLGLWLAQWLFGLAVEGQTVSFDLHGWVVAKALVSAMGVCLLGGAWAFRQARLPDTTSTHYLVLCVVVVLMAGVGIVFPATGLVGGFASIALLSLLAVALAAPLLKRMRARARHIRGPYLVRLSVREALWYPRDLAVALAGLALAVATAIGVGLMIDSFRADFTRMLDQRLSYAVVARGAPDQLASLQKLAQQDVNVQRVQSYAELPIRVKGVPLELVVTRLDAYEAARYGVQTPLPEQAVLLSEQGQRALGAKVGETLNAGAAKLHIAGVFSSFGDVQPRLIVDVSHPLAVEATVLDSLSLNLQKPQLWLQQVAPGFPELDLQLQTEIRQQALVTFDRTFAITTVLIVIALMVAGIGVYVAITTLRLNKRVGTHLLTGLGIYRREDAGMDFALGMGIGTIALLLAVPLGVSFGWILCHVINPRAFGWEVVMQLSPRAIGWPVLWGLLAAALAGLFRLGRQEGVGQLRV